jgi:methyl-accepting chemotaxis protein
MLANTKISTKIYGLVLVLLALLLVASSTGIYQMNMIGEEIVDVAETDIPMTQRVTNITIHQLEQAILFERGLAAGKELATNPFAGKGFKKIEHEFIELGHKVTKEMKEAEELLVENIKSAHTPEMKAEFEHLLDIIKKVDAEHDAYEALSDKAFGLYKSNKNLPTGMIEKITLTEDQIIHQLDAALVEIGDFTADAILTAEHHEQAGVRLLIIVTIIATLMGVVFAFFLVRSITTPVIAMTNAMDVLSTGDRTVEIPGIGRKDEVGNMADSVQIFKENLIKAEELADAQKAEERAAQERAKRIEQLTSDFDINISDRLTSVSGSATQMETTAQTLSATAEQTSQQASSVASAAEQASINVQTVATAAEELSTSISEISRQVLQSNQISSKAVTSAESTNTEIRHLAESASKIGEVVALITDIADQTNLLALNATIEAARAGDAGKGFAVVASEVKNLANQTAKATEEIGTQISDIQSATENAVVSIDGIGKTITEINEITTSISSAVEEQGAATQEIARNVEQAATGTQEVTTNIVGVHEAATATGSASSEVLQATNVLNTETDLVKSNVESFLQQIRTA